MLESKAEVSPKIFDNDIAESGSYKYTINRLSCRLSNQRMSDGIASFGQIEGKRIIDIGCGDGTYTHELLSLGASSVLGIDPANLAIKRAQNTYGGFPNLEFEVVSGYELDKFKNSFDVAILRAVIHHLDDPKLGIQQACQVANRVIVLEPNGYAPVLKILEKISPYHRDHEEQSYTSRQLINWFSEAGAELEEQRYIGLVPMFCPNFIAKSLKIIEPIFENLPLINTIACAQSVMCFKTTNIN